MPVHFPGISPAHLFTAQLGDKTSLAHRLCSAVLRQITRITSSREQPEKKNVQPTEKLAFREEVNVLYNSDIRENRPSNNATDDSSVNLRSSSRNNNDERETINSIYGMRSSVIPQSKNIAQESKASAQPTAAERSDTYRPHYREMRKQCDALNSLFNSGMAYENMNPTGDTALFKIIEAQIKAVNSTFGDSGYNLHFDCNRGVTMDQLPPALPPRNRR